MKILVISQYWAPEFGVPQRRWGWLTGLLREQGHEVTVLAPPAHYLRNISVREWVKMGGLQVKHEQEVGPQNEEIVRTPFFPAGRSLTQRVLNQTMVAFGAIFTTIAHRKKFRGNVDLIIGTVPALPTAFATRVISSILHTPYVIDLRDAWPDLLHEHKKWNLAVGEPSLRERLLRYGPAQITIVTADIVMNSCLSGAKGIISTSSLLLEKIQRTKRELQLRKDKPKGVVIRNVFSPATNFRKEYSSKVDGQKLRILYAGTVGRAQNLTNALEALRILANDGVQIEMRIIGEGAAKHHLQDLAAEGELPVKFLGRVSPRELDEHYMWADTALVHLTDWEPLKMAIPSKLYELMEVGMHVSAVLDGEAAALVKELQAGFVVKPENPQLLADSWKSLSANPNQIEVNRDGANWVREERVSVVPGVLEKFIQDIG